MIKKIISSGDKRFRSFKFAFFCFSFERCEISFLLKFGISEFLYTIIFTDFFFFYNILQMLINGRNSLTIKFGNLLLRKPYSTISNFYFELYFSIICGI